MDTFLNKNIFLHNQTAKLLFHDVAKRLPIIDYHSHIDPKDIAEDRKFFNLTQLWLNGDHYNLDSRRLITRKAASHSSQEITASAFQVLHLHGDLALDAQSIQ